LEELLLVVLDDWKSVMITGEHVSWIPVDDILFESLGLTKSCDILQVYNQLERFLLSFSDTFIIDSSMRRDRKWQRAWRVSRPRPPKRSIFTAYNRSEEDHVRQIVETWCVMMSIIRQVTTNEHRGLPTVINLTQEQLAETGSDKLPSFPWDPGVHFVRRIFFIMLTQVAPKRHTLHLGLVWSGPVGTCPVEQDIFSLLIIMIGHGGGWEGTTSIKILLQMQLLDSKSKYHKYFILMI
jgi:hypothetical protein